MFSTKHLQLILFVLLGWSFAHQTEILTNIKELKKPLKFFTNFLEHFPNFHVVFHANTITIRFVDKMLQYVKKFNTASCNIYNYEVYKETFVRPNVSKVLNVLLSESDDIFDKINSYDIIKYTDVVVFVFWEDSSFAYLQNAKNILRLAGNMLAVHLTEKCQKIYRACFYCGRKTEAYELIFETNTSKLNPSPGMEKLLQLDDFKNMNQHELSAIYMQYYPFVYCQESVQKTKHNNKTRLVCENLSGVESNFLQTLSEKLNFSYTINTLNSTSSFFHMIKNVNESNYDFGFGGISITKDRMPLIQYTMQYNKEDYVFLYLLKLRFNEIFNKFGEPFRSYVVWGLYILCYVLFCAILHLYNIVHKSFKNCGITNIFWMLFHQPLEQSYHRSYYFSSRTKYSAMFVLSLWWSITLIMVTVYKSSVLSSLVHPPNTEPDSFEDLVEKGFCIAGNVNYEDTIHEMLNVNDPLYRKGLSSTTYAAGPCLTLEKILEGNCAMLDELSEIMFELHAICPQINQMNFDDIRVTRKAIRSTGHAWALQKGAPYIGAFDYYISLILSGGLFQKWVANETNKSARKLFHRSREIKEHETRALSFKRSTPIFLVFLVGNSIAIICFILEIILHRYSTKFSKKLCKNII